MHVKVTKQFEGVPEGAVYPKLIKAGEIITGNLAQAALANGWGEETEAPTQAEQTPDKPDPKSGGKADTGPPPAPPAAPLSRARMLKAHKYKDPETGREETLAKGLIIEGDLAVAMAKEGLAQLLVPENKAVTSAPETK